MAWAKTKALNNWGGDQSTVEIGGSRGENKQDTGLAGSTTNDGRYREHLTRMPITVTRTFVDESGALSTQTSSETCQFYDSATGVSRFIVPVEDCPTENLLQHFTHSTEFILAAICSGGTVLVHCLAGASRSPSVVAAFLMEVYRLSPADAIAKIRQSRPLVRPIVGFMDQLHVYAACDYRPLNQPVYSH
jgi:hypothetical protein